jgi:hypothetical protein
MGLQPLQVLILMSRNTGQAASKTGDLRSNLRGATFTFRYYVERFGSRHDAISAYGRLFIQTVVNRRYHSPGQRSFRQVNECNGE